MFFCTEKGIFSIFELVLRKRCSSPRIKADSESKFCFSAVIVRNKRSVINAAKITAYGVIGIICPENYIRTGVGNNKLRSDVCLAGTAVPQKHLINGFSAVQGSYSA